MGHGSPCRGTDGGQRAARGSPETEALEEAQARDDNKFAGNPLLLPRTPPRPCFVLAWSTGMTSRWKMLAHRLE
jgi:hypothetical protein